MLATAIVSASGSPISVCRCAPTSTRRSGQVHLLRAEASALNDESAQIIFKVLENERQKLSTNDRGIAFTLNKVEGLSYQEVSEVMKTTVSSVESLMHRAKNNLKKKLEDYYKNKR